MPDKVINIDDVLQAFASTPIPGYSFPLPTFAVDTLPTALKDADFNKKQGVVIQGRLQKQSVSWIMRAIRRTIPG